MQIIIALRFYSSFAKSKQSKANNHINKIIFFFSAVESNCNKNHVE